MKNEIPKAFYAYSAIAVAVILTMTFAVVISNAEQNIRRLSEKVDAQSTQLGIQSAKLDAEAAKLDSKSLAQEILKLSETQLVSEIARQLSTDKDAKEALRGFPGRDTSAADVANLLLTNQDFMLDLSKKTADQLFQTHGAELITEETVAETAKAVFDKYGKDLKGEPAPPISAQQLATSVAQEPGFAELVKEALQ